MNHYLNTHGDIFSASDEMDQSVQAEQFYLKLEQKYVCYSKEKMLLITQPNINDFKQAPDL